MRYSLSHKVTGRNHLYRVVDQDGNSYGEVYTRRGNIAAMLYDGVQWWDEGAVVTLPAGYTEQDIAYLN